ncbi:MAG TPA: flagellar motor stator protein MotA [Steroidobacteraceae bacterium]|nr:flagellar motor stator protein MotA [Steroidobacteraceae bacterium]
MLQIIGSLVVIGCILGGFAAEGGKILALWHPFEILIIVGSACGAFLISNPPKVVKAAFTGALSLPRGPRYKREHYVTLLQLMFEILTKMRRDGVMSIERDLEQPHDSALFKKYPHVLADHHMVEFITDCLRLIVGGNLDPQELETLLEYELETHHKEASEPAHAVQKVADALPGFGIVAAVLGIVNTMASLEGADTATIGHKVGAALVGTFLGILVSYGFVGPIAAAMEHLAHEEGKAFEVVKMALVASVREYAPSVAVEFARKLLFTEVRPSFNDLEARLKNKDKHAAAAAAPGATAGAAAR